MADNYLERLEKIRWGETRRCAYCNSEKVSLFPVKGRSHRCYKCKTFFSVMSNSFMSHSKLSAEIWYLLIDLAPTEFPYWMVTRQTGTDNGIVKLTVQKIRAVKDDEFLKKIQEDIFVNGA